jgi:sugar lactone lactonase YvrE
VSDPSVLLTGIALGESPRWHDGRLWFADWAAQQLIAVDLAGRSEVIAEVPSFPFSIDWLPDGTLLIVSASSNSVLRREPDGGTGRVAKMRRPDLSALNCAPAVPVRLVPHRDLTGLSTKPWNEIVVDGRGNTYLNNIGFDFPDGEITTGIVGLLTADGALRQVADGVEFPNGMTVTPDNSTLIVAESYAHCLTAFDIADDGTLSNRRIWADLGDAAPDGICLDADGAAWYADVPHQQCVRVAEGGEVLDKVTVDRGCFACMLGGPDGRTLFIVAAKWPDVMNPAAPRTGQVLTAAAPTPGAGWPS